MIDLFERAQKQRLAQPNRSHIVWEMSNESLVLAPRETTGNDIKN